MPDLYKSKIWLRKRYVIEKKSAAEIARECGCSEMTIVNWLRKHELMRNSRTWRRNV